MTRYDIGVELQWYNSAALWYNGAMAQMVSQQLVDCRDGGGRS